ncbi:MAG: hypothetical protein NTZ44_03940 [Candidatus Nomurabacteria bacterium]|nr:hypothetical protein [Candidatus Nomurabacteria bacterium]
MEETKLKNPKIYFIQQLSIVLFIISFLIFRNNPGILSQGINLQGGFFIVSAILLLILSIVAIATSLTGGKPKNKFSYFTTYLGLILSFLLLSL